MNFYLSDGVQVIGPLSSDEVLQFIRDQAVQTDKWQICDKSHVWKSLTAELPNLATGNGNQETRKKLFGESAGGGDQSEVKQGLISLPEVLDLPGSVQHLSQIRLILDSMWERQREKIISSIKNKEPHESLAMTRKDLEAIKEKTNHHTLEFWKKSGVILEWIKELTWGEPNELGDYFFKFTDTDPEKRMAEAEQKLCRCEVDDIAGCYCFLAGDKYLYIGMTEKQDLCSRLLSGHKDKIFWREADSMRILIPKNSRQTKRLERLLILRYNPVYNDSPGQKSSAADDCLELIETELAELFE